MVSLNVSKTHLSPLLTVKQYSTGWGMQAKVARDAGGQGPFEVPAGGTVLQAKCSLRCIYPGQVKILYNPRDKLHFARRDKGH